MLRAMSFLLLCLYDRMAVAQPLAGGRCPTLIDANPGALLPATSMANLMHAGSYFVLSMLDRLWHPDLTQDEAVELMEKGIEEVRSTQAAGVHHNLVGMSCWAPFACAAVNVSSAHCMSG